MPGKLSVFSSGLVVVLCALLLDGCASPKINISGLGKSSETPCCTNAAPNTTASANVVAADPGTCCAPPQPLRLRAVGYGATNTFSQYTVGQQKLMAMRAAKVDAYRSLAEQVYGFNIIGQTSVSAFATQNDNVKTFVETFIRGARIIDVTAIADGNFEAVVELELTPDFFTFFPPQKQTVAAGNTPPAVARASISCVGLGCAQPSAFYYTR